MSEAGGMDNPAFNNADECIGTSANHENSSTESPQQHENSADNKLSPTSNGRSFVSQHYVEPTRNSSETQYKTETRIEVPGEDVKTTNNGKANGVHGNGNNNDVSFLNTSATSVQNNDGKKEQIEAVNLELVSMRPYAANNLQTKGQEACELPSDPYEEYFVPVNEHRKYIRGEKLYVTKDKRSKSSYWRRIACWTFGLTVLALALVIAILAATGVILTQEATKPLENDQPRLLGDVNAAGSQEFIKNPPPSPPPETSSFPPWQTTDESTMKIVPEALDGNIWLDNFAWYDDFMDVKSRIYRSVAGEIEDTLKDMLYPTANVATVKVYNITSAGQIMFRISYPPIPTPEVIQENIEKMLRQNGNMIGKHHLNRMNIKRLIDECEYNNFNCATSCKFDYLNGVFSCTCLPGRLTDDNGNNCIEENDLSNVNVNSDDSTSTTVKDIFQGRSQAPENSFEPHGHDDQMHHLYHHHDHQHDNHEHHRHGEFITEASAEPSTAPGLFSEHESTTESSSKSELKPEPTIGEPKSEPDPVSEPTLEPKSENEPVSEPTSEPKSEPEPSSEPPSEPKSEPEPVSEPTSEPKSEPEPVSEPSSEPEPVSEPTSEPKSELEPVSEPTSEPEPVSEPTSEPKSEPEPVSEPTSEPEPVSEPTSEPKSEPEPVSESTSEPKTEPEPVSEPTSEPKSEPEPDSEPTSEPKSEPEPDSEPTSEPKSEPEPSTTLTSVSELASEPTSETKSEPESSSEPPSEDESGSRPTSEPISEVSSISDTSNKSVAELTSEPVSASESILGHHESEPTREPKSEEEYTTASIFNVEPSLEPTTEPKYKSEGAAQPEPSSEPNAEPQPTSEPDTTEFIFTTMQSQSKSFIASSTTQESEIVTDSVPTVEPLAVIPLISNEETKYISSSEDSTMTSMDDETMQTTQEIIEMLPTAIPKTSVVQPGDHYHHDYDEDHSDNKLLAAVEGKKTITMDFTTQSSTSAETSIPTTSDEESTTKSDYDNSSMDITTVNSNDTNISNTMTDTNIPEMNFTILPAVFQINHTKPQLTPERIDPYTLIHDVLGINVTTENPVRSSSKNKYFSSVIPIDDDDNNTENPIETITMTEEKHSNDMSPFLPDVIHEKENSKKAPRLDKDEQDFPNPFEPHVEDVIVHHHAKINSTMTSNDNINATEFMDLNNDTYLSHDTHQTGTTREEDVSMLDMITTVTSTYSMTEVPDVVDVIDLEQQHIDDMNSKQLTNDTDDERSNNANFNDNKTTVEDIEEEILHNKNHTTINSENTEYHEKFNEKNNETPTFRNKFEDNVEDQYNDIIDENISKKFENNQEKNSNWLDKNSKHVEATANFFTTTLKTIETTEMPENIQTTIDNTAHKDNIKTLTSIRPIDYNKFTTEVPIMPMEIQQDFSTTEVIESTDPTIVNITENYVTNNPMTITTQISMMETKTTTQNPILPDELQTTEASATKKLSTDTNITMELFSSTESINEMMQNDETIMATDIPELTTVIDIKPVSEMIEDDPEPVRFDATHFFTTTEQILLTDEPENTNEENLRVISLDDEYENKNADHDEINENNHFNHSNLKIFEITSASKVSEAENTSLNLSNINFTTTTINSITKMLISDTTTVKTPRKIPEIIPVYEPIEENEENPMLHPLRTIKNNIQLSGINMKAENNEEDQETTNTNMESSTINSIVNVQNYSKPTFMFSKCNAGQFQCVNGTSRDGAYCVNLSSKCDSENDCSDGSDEINCEDAGCPGNFQCRSGQCLGRHLVCNGIGDCDDGSDEEKCDEWICHFDEFKCPNGRCIPDLWRCNGRPDCEDHRDEYSCSESCGNNEYLCPTENWCIPQTWRCNGVPECANGEDEKLCDCALDQFKCQTGGCVALNEVCDGIEHCPDLSDEWDCLTANMSMENVSQILNSDEQMTLNVGQQPTLIKIKQYDNVHYTICTDNWNKNVSDTYCRSLGYFGSEITQTTAQNNGGEKFLRLKENYQSDNSNFVSYLEITDTCETGEIVKISCQEFSCGSVSDNEGPTARLVGGTPAGEGQWSSVALLKEMKNGAACTASVLGPMHALASYSCIHKYRQSDHWELFIGRDLQKSIAVKNIIPYPQVKYNQFMYNNDIVLIQLERPLVFSQNVSAVCLPSQLLQPRALCVTVGWGFPINGDVNLKLNFLPIPIYNTDECNATSHYAGFITKNNICAGFTGTDKGTCYNDEGAPLMCATETGRWEIQGLLSHHSRCSRGHPAIYSSLNPAISWLQHLIPALQMQT